MLELINSDYRTRTVYVTPMFLQEHRNAIQNANIEIVSVSHQVLEGLGTFKTNDAALAVVEMKSNTPLAAQEGEYALLLDDLNDPGNLGTIIRIADWFGLRKIICSESTVDLYNPKVIAAAKGSFTRVQVYYTLLPEFLKEQELPILGADMDGADVHTYAFPKGGYLLMGSEASGIHADLLPFVKEKLSIPAWGGAESLNVAMATAILCDNLRRILK